MTVHATSTASRGDHSSFYTPADLTLLKDVVERAFARVSLGDPAAATPTGAFLIRTKLAMAVLHIAATGERDAGMLERRALDSVA